VTKIIKVDPETTLNRLRRLLDVEPYAVAPRAGMIYGEQIKHVGWTFNARKFDHIEVLHMTDTQYGHVCCNVPALVKYRDWVLAEPYRYVLFGGDMIDAGHIFSPGQPWEQICEPQGQVYKFCELMAPLRSRILGYVGGNHERRTIKTFGDAGLLIASLLQIPYSSGQQFIDIQYGKHDPFNFFLWHGRGAARTPGAKLMMLYYAMRELSGGAHVTLVGHLHSAMLYWATHRKHFSDRIVDQKICGAMSSSFLEYMGSYAEVAGMSPNDLIMARTNLEPNGKWELTVR
jgi:hypothetical protein